jgi:hypothetical protein
MLAVKQQIAHIIDYLPEREQSLVLEIVKRFAPDDIATQKDIEDIRNADEEFAKSEFVRHEDIDWN